MMKNVFISWVGKVCEPFTSNRAEAACLKKKYEHLLTVNNLQLYYLYYYVTIWKTSTFYTRVLRQIFFSYISFNRSKQVN